MSEMQLLANVSRQIDEGGRIRTAGVEAHRIAALVAGGMTKRDIMRDYPNLDAKMVEAAVLYARAHPPEKPYPRRTAKSALRAMGGGLEEAFAAAREPDGA